MKKLIIKESDLISIIRSTIIEGGDLYKKHPFGKSGDFTIELIDKTEAKIYKKKLMSHINIYGDALDFKQPKPEKYYLAQYKDGSCCFVTRMKDADVAPITFNSKEEAESELNFLMKHSPEMMENFITNIVYY